MKSNTEQLSIAKKYLGESCPRCCSMANNCCCFFVSKIFREAGNASLFYGGKTVAYCPNAIKWCKNVLAQIPPYLAMPSDIIFFDWELNGTPNHIGFVANRVSDQVVHTLEGNTTNKYCVAYRNREAKYIQGIFRPHFKATYTTGTLKEDGQFDYNSIAMLQKALGIKVDGILGRDTVKALQKKVGCAQDGSWGVATSKAVQKMVGTTVDGAFGEKSVKALQKWINKQIGKTATSADKTASAKPQTSSQASVDNGKLTVDGAIGTKTVKRMQKFFGTMEDGIISGQKESLYRYYPSVEKDCIRFCDGGSACIAKLQKWLGINEDGILGKGTVKTWQKKLGVEADGIFGTKSAKAWQKYLNEHDEAVYPVIKKTNAEKIAEQAEALAWAEGTASTKWLYATGSARDVYKTALKKFMGYATKVAQSDCGYFASVCVRASGTAKDFLALKGNKDAFPSVPSTMQIAHKGYVADGFLKRGDIVRYKKTSGSQHTYIVMGDSLIAEAGRKVRFPVIRKMKANSKCNASGVKHNTIEVIRAK